MLPLPRHTRFRRELWQAGTGRHCCWTLVLPNYPYAIGMGEMGVDKLGEGVKWVAGIWIWVWRMGFCPNPLQWQVYFAVPSVSALLSFSEGLWFCVLDTSLLLPRRNTIFYCIPVPLSMWIVAFLVVLFSTVYLALLEVFSFSFCLCCTWYLISILDSGFILRCIISPP